jgi:hypothetical protein
MESKDPETLLDVTKSITGICTEMTTMTTEMVDGTAYPDVQHAARKFGEMSGVLDHGSEILTDIGEGSNTFATSYIALHGVSRRTLQEIKEMRKQAAHESFISGLEALESSGQRTIYRTAALALTLRYAKRRADEAASPSKIELALKRAEDNRSEGVRQTVC